MAARFAAPSIVVASGAQTVSGQSATQQSGDYAQTLALAADVTAVSGTTPTCTYSVEWSTDGGVTWFVADPADVFTQVTAAGKAIKTFAVKAPTYRVRWTIAGTTPSFTFALTSWSY